MLRYILGSVAPLLHIIPGYPTVGLVKLIYKAVGTSEIREKVIVLKRKKL